MCRWVLAVGYALLLVLAACWVLCAPGSQAHLPLAMLAWTTSSAVNVYLPKDRVTNEHQGYGFVEFRSEEDADYAIKVGIGCTAVSSQAAGLRRV